MPAVSVNLRLGLNNPGHIERGKTPWVGQSAVQKDARFVTFDTPLFGIRAIAMTLMTYYDKRFADDGSKIDTPKEIATRWSSTDQAAYTANMAKAVGAGEDDTINLHDHATMDAAVTCIVTQENGPGHYSSAQIAEGIKLAGFVPPPKPTVVAAVSNPTVIATTVATVAATVQGTVSSVSSIWDTLGQHIDPRILVWSCAAIVFAFLAYHGYQFIQRHREGTA